MLRICEGLVEAVRDESKAVGSHFVLRLGCSGRVLGAFLEPLGGRLCRKCDPVGDLLLGLASELLDGAIELVRETFGRLLPGLLDLDVEAPLGVLGEPARRPLERTLEIFELAPGGVGVVVLEPRLRLCDFPVYELAKLALAVTDLLRQLLERPPAFGRVLLELLTSFVEHFLGALLQLLAKAGEECSLLVGCCAQLLGIGAEAGLVRGGGLGLALAELRQAGLERPLPTVEVGRPGGEPSFQALLHLGDCLRQLDARLLGLPHDQVAALLGELAFLLAEELAGGRAFAGEHQILLPCSPPGFLLQERPQALLADLARPVEILQAPEGAGEQQEPGFRDRSGEQASCGEEQGRSLDEVFGEIDPQGDPGGEGSEREEHCRRDQKLLRGAVENDRGEGDSDEGEPRRECDLEGSCHGPIVGLDGALPTLEVKREEGRVGGRDRGGGSEAVERELRDSPGQRVG